MTPTTPESLRPPTLALCALVPACLAARLVANSAGAAHDGGVARVLALRPEAWRALDVAVGSLFSFVPLGTRSARAALGGSLVVGATGLVLFDIVSRLLGECAEARRLRFVVAAIATTAPLVGNAWESEGSAVGGSAVGALLILLTIALTARAADATRYLPDDHVAGVDSADVAPSIRHDMAAIAAGTASWSAAFFALGLSASYEPLVGVASLAAFAALLGTAASGRRGLRNVLRLSGPVAVAYPFLAGLAPLGIALARVRIGGGSVTAALAEHWLGEGGHGVRTAAALFREEIGVLLFAVAIAGTTLTALIARARPLAASLLAVAIVGAVVESLGASSLGSRGSAPALAGTGAVFALAAVAMQAIVRAIATAHVPFAHASAAMAVVLELVVPVDAVDEAFRRESAHPIDAAAAWNDVAWGLLPPNTLAIVSNPRIISRVAAARAEGALRGDLVIVDVNAPKALSQDTDLIPLWRDLALLGAPTEASLSSLASTRPVVMAYEPRWGYAMGRHLVPLALVDRFLPEPRGASDRRRALDTFDGERQTLATLIREDRDLSFATSILLDERAKLMVAGGDRELIERSLADLHAFTP